MTRSLIISIERSPRKSGTPCSRVGPPVGPCRPSPRPRCPRQGRGWRRLGSRGGNRPGESWSSSVEARRTGERQPGLPLYLVSAHSCHPDRPHTSQRWLWGWQRLDTAIQKSSQINWKNYQVFFLNICETLAVTSVTSLRFPETSQKRSKKRPKMDLQKLMDTTELKLARVTKLCIVIYFNAKSWICSHRISIDCMIFINNSTLVLCSVYA